MIHRLSLWLFITSVTLPVLCHAQSDIPLFEPPEYSADALQRLLPALQAGGYVIYLRHMTTDRNREDRRPVNLADCETQRPLHDTGRKQAKMLGKAFIRLSIPIDKVLSSPYCRCKDTAKLAFGKFTVREELYFAMGLERAGKQIKGKALRALFGRQPARGKNTIIVSHTANLQEAVGLWPWPEGVAYIFKPDANGNFDVIAKVLPETWVQLKAP